MQITCSIEWEGELSDEDAQTLASELRSLPYDSAEVHTEKSLGGIELIVNTIIIGMATKFGESIVDGVWSAMKLLAHYCSRKEAAAVTLKVTWDDGEVRITLPVGDTTVKQRLDALGKLINPN